MLATRENRRNQSDKMSRRSFIVPTGPHDSASRLGMLLDTYVTMDVRLRVPLPEREL